MQGSSTCTRLRSFRSGRSGACSRRSDSTKRVRTRCGRRLSKGLSVALSGGYRQYQDTHTGVGFLPLRDDGWTAVVSGAWRPQPAWEVTGSYRRDIGFGAAKSDGNAGVRWQRDGGAAWLGVTGSAVQNIFEFRVANGYVAGASVDGGLPLTSDVRLSAQAGLYRQIAGNTPSTTVNWSQRRALVAPGVGDGTRSRDEAVTRRASSTLRRRSCWPSRSRRPRVSPTVARRAARTTPGFLTTKHADALSDVWRMPRGNQRRRFRRDVSARVVVRRVSQWEGCEASSRGRIRRRPPTQSPIRSRATRATRGFRGHAARLHAMPRRRERCRNEWSSRDRQPETCIGCHAHCGAIASRGELDLRDVSRAAGARRGAQRQRDRARCRSLRRTRRPDFISTHGTLATQSTATCAMCHARESCARCHVNAATSRQIAALGSDARVARLMRGRPATYPEPASHRRPDFASAHGGLARANVQTCATCHAQPSCRSCHTGSLGARTIEALPRAEPGRAPGVQLLAPRPAPLPPWPAAGFIDPRRWARPPSWLPPSVRRRRASCGCMRWTSCARTGRLRRAAASIARDVTPSSRSARAATRAPASAAITRSISWRGTPARRMRVETNCTSCHNTEVFCRSCHRDVAGSRPDRIGGPVQRTAASRFGCCSTARPRDAGCRAAHRAISKPTACSATPRSVGASIRTARTSTPIECGKRIPTLCAYCHLTIPR